MAKLIAAFLIIGIIESLIPIEMYFTFAKLVDKCSTIEGETAKSLSALFVFTVAVFMVLNIVIAFIVFSTWE